MKMQKNIYAIMTAAMAASAVLVSSCTKDENAAAPVITFTGQGTTKDTFLYKATTANTAVITGEIVVEAGLKKVSLKGPGNNSTTTNWFKGETSLPFEFEKGLVSSPFKYDDGSPVYPKQNSTTNYVLSVTPGQTVRGSFFGNLISSATSGDKSIVDSFPVGEYTLFVHDDNDNFEYKKFWVVKQMPTYTPTTPPACSSFTTEMLLYGISTGMGKMAWGLATDTIKATGDYFYQRLTTPDSGYGVLRVKKLAGDSAVLTLLKWNAANNRTDSAGTATIYTANNKPSFFVITNTGVAASTASGENVGSDLFVFIRDNGNNDLILDVSSNPGGITNPTAVNVKFLTREKIIGMMTQYGQCTN
jgi:hypothetical protein